MKRFLQKPAVKWILLGFPLLAFLLFTARLLKRNSDVSISDNKELSENTVSGKDEKNTSVIEKEAHAMPLFTKWQTFTSQDGLPSDKANCVRMDGDRVLVGTDAGLAVYENQQWKVYTTEDGLTHGNILSIDIDPETGDVWLATMSGLTRWSAGKFQKYNQFNSGLANDVVYSVICDGKYVWTATAAGVCGLNTHTGQWLIINEQNSPLHEPWTYGVCKGEGDKIYIAAWGGGVVEYNKVTGHFRDHRDPDGEGEIDLFPDDGIVHDITTMVSYQNNMLWVSTYFGLSRYDGVHWNSYFDHDSGLASNFINYIKADGKIVYICSDNGLSTFDGSTWVTYRTQENSSRGEAIVTQGSQVKKITTTTSLSNNFIWGVDIREDEIWVATAKGVCYAKGTGKANQQSTQL